MPRGGCALYKLLIVDDEYQVRTGLRDLIDWNALGITVPEGYEPLA